jgi:hypothetical protein
MRLLLTVAALAALLTTGAYAQAPAEKSGASKKDAQIDCNKLAPKVQAGCGGITPADKENLDRAMGRNVLQSIDDQLRRQRTGN